MTNRPVEALDAGVLLLLGGRTTAKMRLKWLTLKTPIEFVEFSSMYQSGQAQLVAAILSLARTIKSKRVIPPKS
ncbi:hypothetical protein [Hyphomonas adhaerens]|uniref:hypothetical protein n=1 Tax=Hyphomonas adhaerens TaxID=81029 RepID=UPI002356FDE0|nr:hypothetical protein [Hyphomonas adhaerens]